MKKRTYKGWIYPCDIGFDNMGRMNNSSPIESVTSPEVFKLKKSLVTYWGDGCPICRNKNCKPIKVRVIVEEVEQ